MKKFEERCSEFQKKIEILQNEYGVQLYPANVLLQNGEFVLLIKLRDLLFQEQAIDPKKYDQTKEGNSSDKKTQKSTD